MCLEKSVAWYNSVAVENQLYIVFILEFGFSKLILLDCNKIRAVKQRVPKGEKMLVLVLQVHGICRALIPSLFQYVMFLDIVIVRLAV